MLEQLIQGLGGVVQGLEIVGAGVLVLGFIMTTWHWFRDMRQQGSAIAFARYRRAIARVILIGLEILVAATIIKTITFDRTLEGMALLAIMVAIRTVLGWTTVVEKDGQWPWQRPRADAA